MPETGINVNIAETSNKVKSYKSVAYLRAALK